MPLHAYRFKFSQGFLWASSACFSSLCFFPSWRQTTVLWGRQESDTTEHALTQVTVNLAEGLPSNEPLLLLLFLHGTGHSRREANGPVLFFTIHILPRTMPQITTEWMKTTLQSLAWQPFSAWSHQKPANYLSRTPLMFSMRVGRFPEHCEKILRQLIFLNYTGLLRGTYSINNPVWYIYKSSPITMPYTQFECNRTDTLVYC